MAKSDANSYRMAAKEHLERALWLHENEEYFLAQYITGLSVECHLRAYLRLLTDEFTSRHDLRLLARESRFLSIVPRGLEDKFYADFEQLNLRGQSNHRFYSKRQLLDHMNLINAGFNEKGERWKNLSRVNCNLADNIIRQGEANWNKI